MARRPSMTYLQALRIAEEGLRLHRLRLEQSLEPKEPAAAEVEDMPEGWYVPPARAEIEADRALPATDPDDDELQRRRFTPAMKAYELLSPSPMTPQQVAQKPPAPVIEQTTQPVQAIAEPTPALIEDVTAPARKELANDNESFPPSAALVHRSDPELVKDDPAIEKVIPSEIHSEPETFSLNPYTPVQNPEAELSPERMDYLAEISQRAERIRETERRPDVEIRYLYSQIDDHLRDEFKELFPEGEPVDPKAVEQFIDYCDATIDAVRDPARYHAPPEPEPRERGVDDAPFWETVEQERTEARQSTLQRERGDRVAEMWDQQMSDASRQMMIDGQEPKEINLEP